MQTMTSGPHGYAPRLRLAKLRVAMALMPIGVLKTVTEGSIIPNFV